jgi:hypothetical protein
VTPEWNMYSFDWIWVSVISMGEEEEEENLK